MSKFVGIRHEDKYLMESRAPLTPRHVERLIKSKKLDIIVQSSSKRAFSDKEYKDAGALIAPTLDDCSVILGVKEIPVQVFEPDKTYVFFSHVTKGQPYNMPMLKRMMELNCNLIDYEKISDEQGKRLIFFGRYAGLAGMINSLWALGLRLKEYGIDTPFLKISQAHKYKTLDEAKIIISAVGQEIAEKGLPIELQPFTIGFTGNGNVSQGAQEIIGLLPVLEISPESLLELSNRKALPNNLIYKIIFNEQHLSAHNSKEDFDKQEYYAHPENFHSIFENYIPELSVLMNCMYWDSRYPRIVTKDYLAKVFLNGRPKLTVIGDITCDPDGSIEITHKGTEIDEPLFVYNPFTKKQIMGHKGEGLVVMAVDILPSELPRESSDGFGDALVNFIKPISDCDFSDHFEYLDLPKAIKKALILHNGELTHDFRYLENHLKKQE
ncbi:MAG: bifunctional lysine ketoglutarate reductase /saccharopine dehydrogenase family protein [Lentimicrobium sp.]|jgi:alpha-aminoadipic semialdehyde synthase|nr:bifunctional lysine ketoglutarate reductase /saccharopine dehydrogenase family protein [Lentimicrobium sp.]